MSYTTLYMAPASGELVEITDFRNAFGSAAFVWCVCAREFFGHRHEYSWLSDRELRRKIWMLADDASVPMFVRITMGTTFDRVMVKRENLGRVAQAFRDFVAAYPPGDSACSLIHQADVLEGLIDTEECFAVCWNQTSVGDTWTVRDGGCEECGEGAVDRLYDLSRDTGHWFLFEKLGVELVGKE